MIKLKHVILIGFLPVWWCSACKINHDERLFVLMPSDRTGITFTNRLESTITNNILEYDYFYDGSGVAAADFDNDGFTDLFFAGNQVQGVLYRNRGNVNGTFFLFEDITHSSGLITNGWCTGVSAADVNGDGWLDLYVCHAGLEHTPNQLFINLGKQPDGSIRFEERASSAGVDYAGFSTQAAFLDYDRDGDADLYLLNHYHEKMNPNFPKVKLMDGSGPSNDRLFRNDGQVKFTDVTIEAGIVFEGYGLGVNICDLNTDGWPDIYVANDFVFDDLIYINNQNGTFSESARSYLRHTTYSSMGCDIADFNNDFFPDILTLDMKPGDNRQEKMMSLGVNNYSYNLSLQNGYIPQYSRNMLQRNNGNGSFSEIGQMAGISKTDWSWSVLFADLDNDGWKDIYITNGIPRDITNNDFVRYRSLETRSGMMKYEELRQKLLDWIEVMEPVDRPNYAFRNEANGFTFTDCSALWGLNDKGFSNGAVYADLDNDGDLDLVTNNLNAPAFIYQNHARQNNQNGFVRIKLAGEQTLGAKIRIVSGHAEQFAEYSPYRGFQSCQEEYVHFGIGKSSWIDTVEIIWPNGKVSRLLNQQANQVIVVEQDQATESTFDFSFGKEYVYRENLLFMSWNSFESLAFLHEENPFDDFTMDPLLPNRFSRNGPQMATGDLNHDGLDDIWIGGPAKIPGMLFYQQNEGGFIGKEMPDKGFEDQEGLFFDADLDGDLDLYVVSGGNEYNPLTAAYQDRLYINDGNGNLTRRKSSVPVEYASGKCVKAADFDNDGDLDLFIGGRVVPNQYPQVPESFLFVNDGHGNFVNGTKQSAPGLQFTGMVTDAVWTDMDRDGWMDLVLVGEYMSILVFHNRKGALVEDEKSEQTGLWNCIDVGDFDHDGDEDFMIGNWGLNNGFGVSEKTPLSVYAISSGLKAFPVTTVFNSGIEYTQAGYDQLTPVFPAISKKFGNFDAFSHAEFSDIFDKDIILLKLSANYLSSVYVENIGGKLGKLVPLPLPAQIAPLSDCWIGDLNGDTHLDILAVGNSYSPDYITGQQDALSGLLLTGDGKGGFQALSALQSGIQLQGDMKSIVALQISGEQVWLIGTNSSPIQGFRYAQFLSK